VPELRLIFSITPHFQSVSPNAKRVSRFLLALKATPKPSLIHIKITYQDEATRTMNAFQFTRRLLLLRQVQSGAEDVKNSDKMFKTF